MKHRIGYNRLGRSTAHRKAMTRNMLTSLFRHERIRTTKAKALAVRRTAEKMITRSKIDSVHNRRMIGRDIKDKEILAKMFIEIGPRYKERPGGYTRVLKLGPRPSDAAEMVLLELVQDAVEAKPKAAATKSATKKKTKPAAEKAKASTATAVAEKPEEAPVEDAAAQEEQAAAPEAADEPAADDATPTEEEN